METAFYEYVEMIEATHSVASLGVLLAAARAHFEGQRLAHLEQLVDRRLAEVARVQGGTVPAARATHRERRARAEEHAPPEPTG